MKKIPLEEYLKEYGISFDVIIRRYANVIQMLHLFVKNEMLEEDSVAINGNNLIRAIVDYSIDVERIKKFHPIREINKEKVIAYLAYWLLKRQPLQVIKDFDGCDSINELFVVKFITSTILKERKIKETGIKENPYYDSFYTMLYYNLKYRLVTQQSIELMICAFFGGHEFTVKTAYLDEKPGKMPLD